MPKGINCPAQINDTFLLDYDNFDAVKFDSLPDFIKTKMQGSKEFRKAKSKSNEKAAGFYEEKRMIEEPVDDLPF
jgi:hypothetical protein